MTARSEPASTARADSLVFLDGLRGLAAVWVMLHHARWLLWEGWEAFGQHRGDYSWFGRALVYGLAPLRYGHEAVIFFFVLSGFVIHLGYAKRLAKWPASPEAGSKPNARSAHFDWIHYVWRRARRLYPPLLLALGITLAFDAWGASQGWGIYRAETPYALLNGTIKHDLSAWTALGNLAFLMDAAVPCYGSNGPLWSLHFEWWFYMIYPLLWIVARRSVALATGVVVAAFAMSWLPSSGAWFYIAKIFTALLTWWLGALLAEIYAGRLRIPWRRIAPLALLLPAMPVLAPRLGALGSGWAADTIYGFGFAGLFALCFAWRERGGSLRVLEWLRPLGEMSYTLYVIHLPVLVFLSGWLMARAPEGRLPAHFGWLPAGAALCLLLAWGAHFLVERPFVRRQAAP